MRKIIAVFFLVLGISLIVFSRIKGIYMTEGGILVKYGWTYTIAIISLILSVLVFSKGENK